MSQTSQTPKVRRKRADPNDPDTLMGQGIAILGSEIRRLKGVQKTNGLTNAELNVLLRALEALRKIVLDLKLPIDPKQLEKLSDEEIDQLLAQAEAAR